MDKMADVLGRAGAWCGQNKYLSAIKNAFQNFMPLTIAGAIGVLWCNVLVNESTGLGLFFKPIMALDFLNPAFQAVNFCTISCITVGITLPAPMFQIPDFLGDTKKSVFGTWELKELGTFQV